MKTKEELEAAVTIAKKSLLDAQVALAYYQSLAVNNVFLNLGDALGKIEELLYDRAHDDCEGSGNCGDDEYTQEFMVDGVRYMGSLKCEYNRHDKTYYYIDGHKFTYKELP